MKRIVIFLLVLSCSLLTVAKLSYAGSVSNPSLSATASQNLSQSFRHLAMDAVNSLPSDNGTDFHTQQGIDQEDEDDLLRKNSFLPRYVITYLYTLLVHHYESSVVNFFPFHQHQTEANNPLYIRLNVFRI